MSAFFPGAKHRLDDRTEDGHHFGRSDLLDRPADHTHWGHAKALGAKRANVEVGAVKPMLAETRDDPFDGSDWLFVLLDTRVAPAKLTVAFVTQNAPSGQATATLTISGEGAVDQQVTVTLLP